MFLEQHRTRLKTDRHYDRGPKFKQDARLREPGLLLIHKMIDSVAGEKCVLCNNTLQPI